MKLASAIEIGKGIVDFLSPHCTRIDIAGSVARGIEEVHDIEILCTPKNEMINDLFGNPISSRRDVHFIKAVVSLGHIAKGDPKDGKYIRVVLTDGFSLDLFIPDRADYYRQLAIRTGPAEYAHKVIARTWNQNGWCGTPDGLRLKSDCIQKSVGGKVSWVCTRRNPVLPPVWESEEHFFEWLGLNWVPPVMRK